MTKWCDQGRFPFGSSLVVLKFHGFRYYWDFKLQEFWPTDLCGFGSPLWFSDLLVGKVALSLHI